MDKITMELFFFKIIVFLPLLLCFSVHEVAAADAELCDKLPRAKTVQHVQSEVAFLDWILNFPVLLLRICIQSEHEKTYKNGLCPTGYTPFLTIFDQDPQFLGISNTELNDIYKRFRFIGNLPNGDARFTVNMTGDQDVFNHNYTFLALVRTFPFNPVEAKCHENLTIYHLLPKGQYGKSSSTPGYSTKDVVPESNMTTDTSLQHQLINQPTNQPTNTSDSGYNVAASSASKAKKSLYHVAILIAVVVFVVLEVLILAIIAYRHQVPEAPSRRVSRSPHSLNKCTNAV